MSATAVVTADAVMPLDLTIEQEGVGGVTGQAPTVRLRNAATLNSYLDWADNSFKTAGWTLRDAPLPEVNSGHYSRALALASIGAAVGDIYAAEFQVNDGGSIVGVDADLIIVTTLVNGLTTAQAKQLLEIWRMKAADPTVPYVHVNGPGTSPDLIVAGDIVIDVVEMPSGTYTATRRP